MYRCEGLFLAPLVAIQMCVVVQGFPIAHFLLKDTLGISSLLSPDKRTMLLSWQLPYVCRKTDHFLCTIHSLDM